MLHVKKLNNGWSHLCCILSNSWYNSDKVVISVTVNERIKERRLELGMTLEQVAEKLGVKRPTIFRYESGAINIKLSTIRKLAEALQTTPEDLMGWQEEHELKEAAPPKEELDPKVLMLARGMSKLSEDKKDLLLRLVESMSESADGEIKK